jgi:Asp-tRNA(Asn)/Glu-tRNA(Gln) amidotransferase A subunit family amidase
MTLKEPAWSQSSRNQSDYTFVFSMTIPLICFRSVEAFEPFPIKSTDDQFSSFALPSRTKAQAISTSFFAGMRILIKDNIHLKGIKTSVGNRAFYDTYPPRRESAECVQKLIDQDAVILGKTKMNSLATWEEPLEYVDYQAPWGPRAEMYQSPGGSSSGSAAAIATYDWLDIAIGTDSKSKKWSSILATPSI